jgi:hypothetical protein
LTELARTNICPIALKSSASLLTARQWVEFYRQFLRSGNFCLWLEQTLMKEEKQRNLQYIDLLCSSDLINWLKYQNENDAAPFLLQRIQYILVG